MRACLVASALLAGCSLGPPPLPETPALATVALPAAPAGSAPAAGWPGPQWWTDYGDSALDALVAQALRGAPGIDSAAARFGTARENVRVAGATAGLRVDAQAAYERLRLSDNGLLPTELLGFSQYGEANLGVRAQYDLDWWGRKRALLASAQDQALASAAEARLASLALAAAIAEAYFGWQADTARIALLDESLQALAGLQHIASRRESAGMDRGDAIERARQEEARTREQRALLEGSRRLRTVQLAALLGVAVDALPQWPPRALPTVTARWPDAAGLDLIARRPDVQAERHRVEAARRDLDVVRTEYYPDLSLSALAGLSSIELGRLFQAGSAVPSLGAALHLPLFDGLRDARHGVAAAQLNAAVARYNESVVDAAREVAGAAAALLQSATQRAQRERVLAASGESLRMASARARTGLTDRRPELEAQVTHLRELDARVQLDLAAVLADIQLQEALGGGYQPAMDLP